MPDTTAKHSSGKLLLGCSAVLPISARISAPRARFIGSGELHHATARWKTSRLKGLTESGVQPHEIAIFVRSSEQMGRATDAVDDAHLKHRVVDEQIEIAPGKVSVSTMHLAKGLEFRAVSVMASDDEVIPLQKRIETVTDDSDLEDVYNTECQLLYVACTRGRDYLLVTSTEPASEFLEDLSVTANRNIIR